jgi:hypothetical protein
MLVICTYLFLKKSSGFWVTFAAFLELTIENKNETEVESLIEKP